ncbi:hypothetical protein ACFSKY_15555 [Azotobacter chroococcum]|uniref:hypothetical protein n=1 Tax=Azotobacter chroococcum TaxID=353 RepID=UPI00103DC9A4|nr:hypothetical protein [Azotobacter chroococcum]TBV97335.1 hypothetical protein E0E53_08705 [Azotobacter chroococcum]
MLRLRGDLAWPAPGACRAAPNLIRLGGAERALPLRLFTLAGPGKPLDEDRHATFGRLRNRLFLLIFYFCSKNEQASCATPPVGFGDVFPEIINKVIHSGCG